MKYCAFAVGLTQDGHQVHFYSNWLDSTEEWARLVAKNLHVDVEIYTSQLALVKRVSAAEFVDPPKGS